MTNYATRYECIGSLCKGRNADVGVRVRIKRQPGVSSFPHLEHRLIVQHLRVNRIQVFSVADV